MEGKSAQVDKMTRMVDWLERIVSWPTRISGYIGEFAALAMVLLIILGVTARYVLHIPLSFDAEYTGYLLVLVSFVGAAYALKAGSHVRVDIIIRLLPKKVGAWMQVVTDMLSLGVVVMLLWYMVDMTYTNWGRVASGPMETPLGPVQLMLPLGALLFLLQLIVEFSKSLRNVRSS